MSIVTKTIGSAAGRDYPATVAGAQQAWNDIPNDLTATDISLYRLQFGPESEIVLSTRIFMGGKKTDAAHRIEITATPGGSYMDNPNVGSNPFVYNPANGAAIRVTENYSKAFDIYSQDWVTVFGLQIANVGYGNSGSVVSVDQNGPNVVIKDNILKHTGSGGYVTGISLGSGAIYGNLIEMAGLTASAVMFTSRNDVKVENNIAVKPSTTGRSSPAYVNYVDPIALVNCASFGFDSFVNDSTKFYGSNNGSDNAIAFGSNNKGGLVAAEQIMNVAGDYRLKSTSALVDAGTTPSAANAPAPNGARQQGLQADIGAWEAPSAIQSPTATITSIAVSGQSVTISGTTTGTPTTGNCSITPASVPYNNAVSQGPVSMSFGTNTFSAQFTGVKVGTYSVSGTVANSNFNATATSSVGTSFNVTGPLADTVVQDPINGQVLTIRGTTTGNPTSGSLTVPVDTTSPDGAIEQVVPLILGNGTFTVSVTLASGNYGAPRLTLTNSSGTSLPQAGTRPVSIIGISGNPEAPGSGSDTPAPTVTGVTVSPGTATGSTTFTATVAGTNNPPQGVSWAASAGSITSAGVFTAPAATGAVQNITITATSLVDGTKSGNATVTIAAATVTGVAVSPSSAAVRGGETQQFSAMVSGANSPAQSVTWTASAGSITSTGLFTAPAANSTNQSVTITATSTADGSKSGTAAVTVAAMSAQPPTVTSVSVTPSAPSVSGLSSRQFTATVQGTNSPSQSVIWSATAGSINASGLFTAPAATSATQTITVTATSALDGSKSGTATVTIPAQQVIDPPDTGGSTAQRVFSVQLTVDGTVGVPNLAGLIVRCYNGDGSLALSINNGTTDANGWVSVAVQSTLGAGGIGLMVVIGAGRHFVGFVQVA